MARLRPLCAADRATSVRWRNDPDIRDNILGYRFPITEEMEGQWVDAVLKDQSRTRLVLAVEDKADGALVGFAYLNGIDWFARNAELGMLIGERSRQGKGLAKEALALVAGYAFDDAQPQQALSARCSLQRQGLAALSRLRLCRGRPAAPAGVRPRPLPRRRAHGPDPQP